MHFWTAAVGMYECLLLILLLYFSFKNSQISPQLRAHAEEGQAGTRLVVAITVMTFVAISAFSFLQINFAANYIALFWTHVIYTSLSTSLYLIVIFVPKVFTSISLRQCGDCVGFNLFQEDA